MLNALAYGLTSCFTSVVEVDAPDPCHPTVLSMEDDPFPASPRPIVRHVPPPKQAQPVEKKDTFNDYLSGYAFLCYRPNQIIGVRLINETVRYALFDHARQHLCQGTLNTPADKKTVEGLKELAKDFCPLLEDQEVVFKRYTIRPGCEWLQPDQQHVTLIESNEQLLWRIHDLALDLVYFTDYENALLLQDYTDPQSKISPLSQRHVESVDRFHLQSLRIVSQKIQELIFISVPWTSHLNPAIGLNANLGAVTIVSSGPATKGCPSVVGHAQLVMETVENGRYLLHYAHIYEDKSEIYLGTPAVVEDGKFRNPTKFYYEAKGKTCTVSIAKIRSIKDEVHKERTAYERGEPIVFFQLVPTGDKYNCSRWCYEKLCNAGVEYTTVVSRAALLAEGVSRLTAKYSVHQLKQAPPHIADFAVRNLVTATIATATNGRAIVHIPAGCVSDLIKTVKSSGLDYYHPTPDFSLTLNPRSPLVRLCVEGTYLFQPSAIVRPVLKRLKSKS